MADLASESNSEAENPEADGLEDLIILADDSAKDPEGDEDLSFRNLLVGVPLGVAGGMAKSGARLVAATAGTSFRIGRAMLRPERLAMMQETGLYLRDLREIAGLTLMELSESLDLEDKTLLEAVENGTATLSFELILRLAALVARHDPVPFVMRMTRTYNPAIWRILHDWGVGRVTLQFERERQFVNLLRRHDAARLLSDEGFEKVLEFTRSAFDLALHYAINEEGLTDRILSDDELEKNMKVEK